MKSFEVYSKSVDVFIVGGGPAGLATAIAARRHGLSVIVADGAIPPIDKPCGEGLMPDGVEALHNLGDYLFPKTTLIHFAAFAFVSDGPRSRSRLSPRHRLRNSAHRICIAS